jgi:hypothetical protein
MSEELGLKHILGCEPMVFNDQEGRQALIKDREKVSQVFVFVLFMFAFNLIECEYIRYHL